MPVRFISTLVLLFASGVTLGQTIVISTFTYNEDWKVAGPVLLPCYKVHNATLSGGVLIVSARKWRKGDHSRHIRVEDRSYDIVVASLAATIIETGNVPICQNIQ